MKKYLIMVLAIAISGVFVGCHEEEISGSLIEQKKIVFEDAFIKAFGQPDPTHNWGFLTSSSESTEAITRTINVNGNLWDDCPAVGSTEEADVLAYLTTLQNKEKNPVRLENYFVTQIHKGTETYNNQDNGYVGVGSDKMNNLHIAMSSTVTIDKYGHLSAEGPTAWDHINNFNAGTCNDWGAGDEDGEGNTLVLNGGTFDFAYEGADDSKYHNRWCSIDGKDVPKTGGGNYAGYYYICFDFEQNVDGKTAAYFKDENGNPYNFNLPGAYHNVTEATGQKFTLNGKEYTFGVTEGCTEWRIDNVINGNMIVDPNSSYKDWIVRLVKAKPLNIAAPQVLTVSENSGGYYRIYQDVVEAGRVMCEDLAGASGNLDDLDYNDVVFDAVSVHEYKKPVNADGSEISGANAYDDAYFVTVRLMAAGGTIPVTMTIGAIKNEETGKYEGGKTFNIHNELDDPTTGYIMLNTLPNTEEARKEVSMAQVMPAFPKTLTYKDEDGNISDKFYSLNNEPIRLESIELDVLYDNVSTKLANSGAVPLKFKTPLGTPWARERKRIDSAYPGFPEWVKDKTKYIWENDNVPNNRISANLYLENESEGILAEYLVGLDEADFNKPSEVIQGSAGSSSKILVNATSTMAYPSSSETVLFDFHPENATNATPGFLCPAVGSYSEEALSIRVLSSQYGDFVEGKTIRIYGVNYVPEGSEPDWYVSTNFTGNQKFTSFNANGNYIEIKLDADNINQIRSGITIQGKHFTVTYVTIATPAPAGGGDNILWEGTKNLGYGTDLTIEKAKFAKATSTSQIKFTATYISNQYPQIHIKKKIDQNNVENIAQVFAANDWPGSVTFTIGDHISVLKNNDICIQGGGLTMTKIELIP